MVINNNMSSSIPETTWDPPDEYLSIADQEKKKLKAEEQEKKKEKLKWVIFHSNLAFCVLKDDYKLAARVVNKFTDNNRWSVW